MESVGSGLLNMQALQEVSRREGEAWETKKTGGFS